MTNLNGNKIDLGPEEGWVELTQRRGPGDSRSFLDGGADCDRLRFRFYLKGPEGPVVGKVWFGPGAEGPPGHAHGGSIAALLDQVMGNACWTSGHGAMTASMTIDYRNRVPLGVIATFEGWVENIRGRKVFPRSKLVGPDGTLYAEGSGLFIAVDGEKFMKMAKQAGAIAAESARQTANPDA